ncbi:hypothetical protein Q8G81_31910, partial [Klebsiella pneumoniae]
SRVIRNENFLLKLIISLVVIYGCLGVVFVSENLSDNTVGIIGFCGLILLPTVYKFVGTFFKAQ